MAPGQSGRGLVPSNEMDMRFGNLIHTCGYRVWRHYWAWSREATLHRAYHDNQPGSPTHNQQITHCPRCGQRLLAKDLIAPPVASQRAESR